VQFNILTLFPEVVESYLNTSIIGDARAQKLIQARTWHIRDFATDKHRTVDDTPYGGGAGMILKIEPIDRTLEEVGKTIPRREQHVVVLAARGRPFNQEVAAKYASQGKALTLICGRYEGIDQRVVDHLADEEVSIGPYVLAGGELAALVIVEAVARLIPGVLGNPNSLKEESFSQTSTDTEYTHYTKPADYKGWKVPEVLLSGDHAAIKQWRQQQMHKS
jgi:tRNA (guanine37-N1)-methyltransferase